MNLELRKCNIQNIDYNTKKTDRCWCAVIGRRKRTISIGYVIESQWRCQLQGMNVKLVKPNHLCFAADYSQRGWLIWELYTGHTEESSAQCL